MTEFNIEINDAMDIGTDQDGLAYASTIRVLVYNCHRLERICIRILVLFSTLLFPVQHPSLIFEH